MCANRRLRASGRTFFTCCRHSLQVSIGEVTSRSRVGLLIPSKLQEAFAWKLLSDQSTGGEMVCPDGLRHRGRGIVLQKARASIGFSPNIVGALLIILANVNTLLLRYWDLVKLLANKAAEWSGVSSSIKRNDATDAWVAGVWVLYCLHLDDSPALEEARAKVQLFPNIVGAGRNRKTSGSAFMFLKLTKHWP